MDILIILYPPNATYEQWRFGGFFKITIVKNLPQQLTSPSRPYRNTNHIRR